jgi:ribosomal protein S6--L-glutamate ligase
VVIIGRRIVHAYWRIASQNEFRSNLAQGGSLCLDAVPQEALKLALDTACSCRWDDVGIDICRHAGRYYVFEANMKYGKEGFRKAGIDYTQLMEAMIQYEDI